jgi:hypothetical protein
MRAPLVGRIVVLLFVANALSCTSSAAVQNAGPVVVPLKLRTVTDRVESAATLGQVRADAEFWLVARGVLLNGVASQNALLTVHRAGAVARIVADPPLPPRPRRVLMVGSSSMEHGIAQAVARELQRFGAVHIRNEGLRSTGLSRMDYFDWLTTSALYAEQYVPDLVVAQFGGNDCQGTMDADGNLVARWGTDAWDAEYARRLQVFFESMQSVGATVVLIGMPTMREERFRSRIDHLNAVSEQAAEAAGVAFVSIREITSDDSGEYIERSVVDGEETRLRSDDGVHLSLAGAALVGEAAIGIITGHMNLTRERPLSSRDEGELILERQNFMPARRPRVEENDGSGASDGAVEGDGSGVDP